MVLAVLLVIGLAGCTSTQKQEATTENLRISAEQIEHFDGYCGVGVRVENVGAETVTFASADAEVFEGSNSTDWNLPFTDVEPGGEAHGYVVGDFGTSLEPGEVVKHAVMVSCDDTDYTLTVNSARGDTAVFKFEKSPFTF